MSDVTVPVDRDTTSGAAEAGGGVRFGAIVLAAGLSSRMGQPKALLPFGDEFLLQHVVRTILATDAAGMVCVVTGHEREKISDSLRSFSVRLAHNASYASGGMLSSIQTGVIAVKDACDAFFIVLGDQPMVRPETINAMTRAWPASKPRVMLPTYGGGHGHPILLSAQGSDEIISLPSDATLKTYTSRYADSTIEVRVDDPAILEDIDTPAEYDAAVRRLRSDSCPSPSQRRL